MNEKSKTEISSTLRLATLDDLDKIALLEKEIFPDPWPQSAFQDMMDQSNWRCFVAELNDEIIAYACIMWAASECHLANIAVSREYRRKLVAKSLFDLILSVAREERCDIILLEVRESNSGAISFYKKYDFKVLYRRAKYYSNPSEAALVMSLELNLGSDNN